MSIHVICFSKDRPLQLHGYLSSLFARWIGDVRVSVLVKSEGDYEPAYRRAFATGGGPVNVLDERVFASDVRALIYDRDAGEFTCFGVDDAVWVSPLLVSRVEAAFAAQPDLLGVSLRLGRNIRRNLWAGEVAQPVWTGDAETNAWLTWHVEAPTSRADWAYPWEVIGTVYRTEYVKAIVNRLINEGRCNSPSQLEHFGMQHWQEYTAHRHMACPWRSAVALPYQNRVQQEFPNPAIGNLSTEFLLDCWHHGLRLDYERFASKAYDAIHVPDFFLRTAD